MDAKYIDAHLRATNELFNPDGEQTNDFWEALEQQRTMLTEWSNGRAQAHTAGHKLCRAIKMTTGSSELLYRSCTINPSPTWKLSDFVKRVHKIPDYKYVDEAYYVFEQRGDTEETMGQGFHIHVVIRTTLLPGQLANRLKNTFPDSLIDVPKKGTAVPTEFYHDYMHGIKDKDHKTVKLPYDVIWRSENGLQNKLDYSPGESLTCIPPNPLEIIQC